MRLPISLRIDALFEHGAIWQIRHFHRWACICEATPPQHTTGLDATRLMFDRYV